jgi:hypothetical protein
VVSQLPCCRAFEECIREGFFEYDERHYVIYIPNFQLYNAPHNPNIVKKFAKKSSMSTAI